MLGLHFVHNLLYKNHNPYLSHHCMRNRTSRRMLFDKRNGFKTILKFKIFRAPFGGGGGGVLLTHKQFRTLKYLVS